MSFVDKTITHCKREFDRVGEMEHAQTSPHHRRPNRLWLHLLPLCLAYPNNYITRYSLSEDSRQRNEDLWSGSANGILTPRSSKGLALLRVLFLFLLPKLQSCSSSLMYIFSLSILLSAPSTYLPVLPHSSNESCSLRIAMVLLWISFVGHSIPFVLHHIIPKL